MSLSPELRITLRGFIAWAQREDGDPAANDPERYREVSDGVVWGPGGVLVWNHRDCPGQWCWADDLDDSDSYYTVEYFKEFPI